MLSFTVYLSKIICWHLEDASRHSLREVRAFERQINTMSKQNQNLNHNPTHHYNNHEQIQTYHAPQKDSDCIVSTITDFRRRWWGWVPSPPPLKERTGGDGRGRRRRRELQSVPYPIKAHVHSCILQSILLVIRGGAKRYAKFPQCVSSLMRGRLDLPL